MDTLTRMRAFIDVVEAEGFSAAGRKVGRSKALLSKYVRELEDDLGTLLLNRTTRQFSLTEAGHTYFHRATEIIRDIDSLSESVREASGDVRGRIKISAPRTFADGMFGSSLTQFALDHPDIKLEIHLDDRFVDLVEEGYDLAIRITRLNDSSMFAKRLADFALKVCASPDTVSRLGAPSVPSDLTDLPCIIDTNLRSQNNWPFRNAAGEVYSVAVSGPMEVNSPVAVRTAALAGLGFALAPDFIVAADVAEGRLLPFFEDQMLPGGGIYAVYPHRRYQPARVRLFIDYMARWFKTNDLREPAPRVDIRLYPML